MTTYKTQLWFNAYILQHSHNVVTSAISKDCHASTWIIKLAPCFFFFTLKPISWKQDYTVSTLLPDMVLICGMNAIQIPHQFEQCELTITPPNRIDISLSAAKQETMLWYTRMASKIKKNQTLDYLHLNRLTWGTFCYKHDGNLQNIYLCNIEHTHRNLETVLRNRSYCKRVGVNAVQFIIYFTIPLHSKCDKDTSLWCIASEVVKDDRTEGNGLER